MSREFKIVNSNPSVPTMGSATLEVRGEGVFAPCVSITVVKTLTTTSVLVYASTWTEVSGHCIPELHSIMHHHANLREAWADFQELRELFGLKGV